MWRLGAVIVALIVLAATLRGAFIEQEVETRLAIYAQEGGAEITDRVQFVMGHKLDPTSSAPPSLGAFRVLRAEPDMPFTYILNPEQTAYVFVIGAAEGPVYASFAPQRLGHARRYEVFLDRLLD